MDPTQETAPAPASPAKQLADALAMMNHPSNLAVPDRLHAIQNAINVLGAQLLPLLPTE